MTEDDRVRHSQAENAELVSDSTERAHLEASNALKQAARVREMVLTALERQPFKLRPSALLDLNRCAIQGLDAYAGNWRPAGIEIGQSKHEPPNGHLVPELVEELCEYVNEHWEDRTSVHLASFVMWRLNWIHPFTDGNGRTSRAASYLVLCAHLGTLLPGRESIPEQIIGNRPPYYDALEAADQRYAETRNFDEDIVHEMEELMAGMLAQQLKGVFEGATGSEEGDQH